MAVLVLAVLMPSAFGDQIEIWSKYVNPGEPRLTYVADRESLLSLGNWRPGRGTPVPLTRDQAVAIAKEAARQEQYANVAESGMTVEFKEAYPRDATGWRLPGAPDGVCVWFYRIVFHSKDRRPEKQYLVTLDGKVAEPLVKR